MEFVNTTPIAAKWLNTMFGEDQLLGAVVARPTFRIDGDQLVPTPDVPSPVDRPPPDLPDLAFPADVPFLSGGIDVFVIGRAWAPRGETAAELKVDVRVGNRFHRTIRVVGDRVWRRDPGLGATAPLTATAPVPFGSMPLEWGRAFGGAAVNEGQELAWPANPMGRGLYFTPEQAEGQALPNVEDPDAPITTIDDRPEPVGTAPYPAGGSLRSLNAIDLAIDPVTVENSGIRRIKPLMFNAAPPRMIIPPADGPRAGDVVEFTNVSPVGPIRFRFPDLTLHAHVQLENRNYLFPLHLDQLGLLTEKSRVFLSYRVAFTYRFAALERRRVTLRAGPAPAAVPADYPAVWED
jgi:hypothetical protein